MDRYLLDTHTAIWFFNGDNNLSEIAKKIILEPSSQKYLSIASIWELAIKINLEKLEFNGKAAGFAFLAESNFFTILPIKTTHLTTFESLPLIHRDPFDRLLVASAIAEQMTLVTTDDNISKYNVSHIW